MALKLRLWPSQIFHLKKNETMNQNGNIIPEQRNGKQAKQLDTAHFHMTIEELFQTNDLVFDDEVRMKCISDHFRQIMMLLGLNMNDDSLKGTPDRVAKMYVTEIFSGLNPRQKPNVTLFENSYRYNEKEYYAIFLLRTSFCANGR